LTTTLYVFIEAIPERRLEVRALASSSTGPYAGLHGDHQKRNRLRINAPMSPVVEIRKPKL